MTHDRILLQCKIYINVKFFQSQAMLLNLRFSVNDHVSVSKLNLFTFDPLCRIHQKIGAINFFIHDRHLEVAAFRKAYP